MRLLISILLIALTFNSCKKDITVKEGDYAFIGGEIINPSDNKIILSKSNTIIDTILLDKQNRFLYKINNLEPGLYAFKLQAYYGVEFQLALLEPKDSIMLRLNTIDFDESLVYTGIGAKKNNYLINMFLKNEEENEKILKFCQLQPEVFENRLDSLRRINQNNLQTFNAKYNTSDLFKIIAQGNIDYNYYLSKEIYPFAYYGDNEIKNLKSLPENFYSYRKDIDYNNEILKDYFSYDTFLRYHFRNLALSEHLKHSNDKTFNRGSLPYNLKRLELIDSLISNEKIKNPLLSMSTMSYLNNTKDIDSLDKITDFYYAKSTDEFDKNHIKKLVSSLKQLKIGNDIPNIDLLNYKSEDVSLRSIINKPTVIHFWSRDYKSHFKESHNKIKELKGKYPEVNFISINVDEPKTKSNHKVLLQYNYTTEGEYQLKYPKKAKQDLAINPIIKVMIIDKKGKIAEAHTNMFSVHFEEQLLGLLNK
ncbi:thioredoxin-like domain-containing protein [Lacinutrix iliipiscaria]|uniref:Thioredoxin-like domain-containing protein n=1 Tax=Lacinutrix iliipiscaria TaxID=1230532 RepID=A0ABW5WQF9_9FLAO